MSSTADLVVVVDAIVYALREHGVAHFVTGSLASSLHGEFRATNDIDIVADMSTGQIRALLTSVATQFVVDTDEAERAFAAGFSFNLIHSGTFLKVDLFPATGAFEQQAIGRAESVTLPGATQPLSIATREDILLAKLRWYRLGGESSAIQWRDIEGLVALNSERFDMAHVSYWAVTLRVTDLLHRAFRR